MKKRTWMAALVAVAVVIFTGCLKTDNTPQCIPNTFEQDSHVIDSFQSANGSNLSYNDTYGGYIGVTNPGSGNAAVSDSIVAFKQTIKTFKGDNLITIKTDSVAQDPYTGAYYRFSDFQTGSPIYYLLTNVQKGGTIRVIYPSRANSLGVLGCDQQALNTGVVIPAYSQVIIDMELTGVRNGR